MLQLTHQLKTKDDVNINVSVNELQMK